MRRLSLSRRFLDASSNIHQTIGEKGLADNSISNSTSSTSSTSSTALASRSSRLAVELERLESQSAQYQAECDRAAGVLREHQLLLTAVRLAMADGDAAEAAAEAVRQSEGTMQQMIDFAKHGGVDPAVLVLLEQQSEKSQAMAYVKGFVNFCASRSRVTVSDMSVDDDPDQPL
jgi:hypothetical protein